MAIDLPMSQEPIPQSMDTPMKRAVEANGDQPRSEEMILNDHCSLLVGIRNLYLRYEDRVFVASGTWHDAAG